jgi:hypothetical protein
MEYNYNNKNIFYNNYPSLWIIYFAYFITFGILIILIYLSRILFYIIFMISHFLIPQKIK